jgi:pimeloyl-ACP methyl ester carboxylesterase
VTARRCFCCTAFPDTGRLWRNQVPALAGAGFQVIVPELRGYGRSDKPEAVDAYSLPVLAGDVMAILNDLGITKAHMVGHDWGAALAWVLASLAPGNVDHLVALSVGNPVTFRRTLEQHEKSWYMLLFQFPDIAELAGRRQLGQLPALGAPPRRRPGDRRPGSGRFAHAGPELVPRQPDA